MSKLWKKQSDCFVEALDYVKQRQLGLIKSLKTPWPKFNDAGIDGIEWNSVLVIGARPGVGKSLIKDQIIRESFALNKDTQFRVLKFEFEMLGRATAIREFSSVLSKSYKYICSAESSLLQDAEYERMKQYSANVNTNPIDIIEKPVTVPDFIEIIHEYMKEHIVIGTDTKPKYTNTVISIDHTWLFVRAKSEKDKLETMYALGEAVTYLKRIYPILFIILSQLNRNVENPERCENGKYGNLINDGDFFGSDAMNQHTDILIGIDRPAKRKITYYGPDKHIIDSESILALRFIKTRNGEPRTSFFKAEYEKMRIIEMSTPPCYQKRI